MMSNKTYNIVIVDDEEIYHKLISLILKKENYNVLYSSNYDQLKEILTNFDDCILLLDYNMGGEETGAKYIRTLKNDGFQDIDFIAVSSLPIESIRDEMFELGAFGIVRKDDFMITKLVRRINELREQKEED